MRRLAIVATCLVCTLLSTCGKQAPLGVRTIVLITVDTLRRDHVSAYAPPDVRLPQPATKAIDGLARQGLRFDEARTEVPLTLPSHVTMMTGLPPAATGVRLNTYGRLAAPAARGFPLLAERLRDSGWHTAAFLSADALHPRYGLDQGFETYDATMADNPRRSAAQLAERPGADTVRAALAYTRGLEKREKLFLWVHLFEPHAPYAADGTYAGDVESASRLVGTLLRGLEGAGRRRGAAILLTADHGEALGELKERSHGFLLADGVLRVPFLLVAPGVEPGVRHDPVELTDVAPTLASLAGISWPHVEGPGGGVDLLAAPTPADRVQIAESLYGHHLHRWAQLVGASSAHGTLVDAGRDRLHWIPRSGYQRQQAGTRLVTDDTETRRLATVIAEYRQFEQPDRMQGGQVAAGYGGGGRVAGFLPPAENARLPDPHGSILRHYRLDDIKRVVVSRPLERALRAALRALDALARPALDQGSPELQFWIGEANLRLAPLTRTSEAKRLLERSEQAFLRSFELGRTDTQTLTRACGVNAKGNERACLERLERLVRQVPQPGCPYWILKIRLLRDLGETAAAEAACKAGEPHCRAGHHAPIWARTCR